MQRYFLLCLLYAFRALPSFAQTLPERDLIGHWDLTVYEIKGKDEHMNLWFDNQNVDSSFTLLVAKLKEEGEVFSTDSLEALRKEYLQQVHYLSKSYFKFLPNGKCKYNVINQHEKFRSEDDVYTLSEHTLTLGSNHRYEVVSLSAKRLVMLSNGGKLQLTYTKQ